jgi:hypothetical protein
MQDARLDSAKTVLLKLDLVWPCMRSGIGGSCLQRRKEDLWGVGYLSFDARRGGERRKPPSQRIFGGMSSTEHVICSPIYITLPTGSFIYI